MYAFLLLHTSLSPAGSLSNGHGSGVSGLEAVDTARPEGVRLPQPISLPSLHTPPAPPPGLDS